MDFQRKQWTKKKFTEVLLKFKLHRLSQNFENMWQFTLKCQPIKCQKVKIKKKFKGLVECQCYSLFLSFKFFLFFSLNLFHLKYLDVIFKIIVRLLPSLDETILLGYSSHNCVISECVRHYYFFFCCAYKQPYLGNNPVFLFCGISFFSSDQNVRTSLWTTMF